MPPLNPLRIGEHVHGHLGWLAAAALLHPAVLLRSRSRRAHLSVALAAVAATLVGALGVALYTPYRERLRQPIFAHARSVGYLFERKEHLAFGAILLAWVGTVAYAGATRAPAGDVRSSLRRASHYAFIASAALAVVTALLGTVVAAYETF